MPSAADVDRSSALRVVLRAVDVRPCSRVQDELGHRVERRRRERHVPRVVREREDVVGREGLLQRAAELAAGAGDQDSPASRSERIGDFVLQRSTTRGSFHGNPCSSGSAGSYSSVT